MGKPDFEVGELKLNSKSITLSSKWLKAIQIEDTIPNNFIELGQCTNAEQLFTVTFDSPEYLYVSRKVFKDSPECHCVSA